MRAILRNDDAEALLLDIRVWRTAVGQKVGNRAGAFLVFPTSVVIAGRVQGQSVYPLRCDVEPGAIVTAAGMAQVSGVVAGITVTGTFDWSLGDEAVPPARYCFGRRGHELPAPAWADQLPRSQQLPCLAPAPLARQQKRLGRRGRAAEHWLLTLTEQVIQQSCRGPIHHAIRYRPPIDVDDVVQRGLQAACRLLPLYTSNDRPPCSWLGMLRLDGRRDMHREVSRLDWLPADMSAALTLADAFGVQRLEDPVATLAELHDAAEEVGQKVPRVAAAQLDAALRARDALAHEVRGPDAVAGPESHPLRSMEGPPVAATVARLVTDDTDLIARAAAGDPGALNQVGDQVVRRLSASRESWPRARCRYWEEFRHSGQLFASATGLERFGAAADPASLAAIDECLRRAAGVHVGPNR